jgi:hypothetical protein
MGAYALDALEPAERILAESHLRTCASCREELESMRQTLAQLSGPEPPAGDALWNRIAGSLEGNQQSAEAAPLAPNRRRTHTLGLRLASAMAAAAVAVMGFMGFRLIQQDDRINALETRTSEEGLLRAAALAGADPGAERITLRSPDERLVGDIVILPDGQGYLVRHNLPEPEPESSYQLWALIDQTRISMGLVDSGSEITPFRAPVSATGLAITKEPAGGVSISGKAPTVVGLRRA